MIFAILLIFIIVFTYTLTCLNKHHGVEKSSCDHTGKKESMASPDPIDMAPAPVEAPQHMEPESHGSGNDGDYNQYIISNTLESSVLSSHRNYAADLPNTTHGASARTVKSNLELDNPTRGLRLVPAYVPVSENARTVPSQTEETIRNNWFVLINL
jgi:hypothetical protein